MSYTARRKNVCGDAGTLTSRFALQRKLDGAAGRWRTITKTWGKLAGTKAEERWSANDKEPRGYYTATLRRVPGLDANARLALGGRIFEIAGVLDDQPMGDLVECELVENPSPWQALASPRLLLDSAVDLIDEGNIGWLGDGLRPSALVNLTSEKKPTLVTQGRRARPIVRFTAGQELEELFSRQFEGGDARSLFLVCGLQSGTEEVRLVYASHNTNEFQHRFELVLKPNGALRVSITPDGSPSSIVFETAAGVIGSFAWHVVTLLFSYNRSLTLRVDGEFVGGTVMSPLTFPSSPSARFAIGARGTAGTGAVVEIGGLALMTGALPELTAAITEQNLRLAFGTGGLE